MAEAFDILVIGSGVAGLSVALAAAPRRVAVLSRGAFGEDGSSAWAQGGIAAALGEGDSPALHAADTLAAGQRRNDPEAVARLTEAAPATVRWLDALGARFDRGAHGYALGREAAHAHARIVHARGDATGAEVMRALRAAARAAAHVTVLERRCAFELARAADGRVAGVRAHGPAGVELWRAGAVVLASGGIGAVYRYTTNPAYADGSGLALALAAGAEAADLEFVQFHPTALAPRAGERGQLPLLTEALRGAGAVLLDARGRRFMPALHPDAELAPRDVVARAVWAEGARGGAFLDATRAVGGAFPERFPTVFAACMARGLDPRRDAIPVVPAEHYHMGGVRVDAQARTSLPGLYAVGEVAASGVHGANRLASNSLLEGLAFGRALGERLAQSAPEIAPAVLPGTRDWRPLDAAADAELADLMWRHAALVREARGLQAALAELAALRARLPAAAHGGDRLLLAQRMLQAMLARRESVGAHYRSDAPRAACA
ncbi:L-aspartate oxidase [Mizugakiibacter sediminis]|uniref:L-aspartate oxidase n=1 Tax=Mizugakiibacter sediminis TaxID=1475481 RepID=A0A0K8QMP9_9GAMM|nr:L-aspartate oxidase [Mizugakiibacter sediminis]GAP66016.1 L-aspartate oxidase [Mizugakiibacter sediminis]